MKSNQDKVSSGQKQETGLSKEGTEARRKYYRNYYSNNKERYKRSQKAYWERIGSRSTDNEVAED